MYVYICISKHIYGCIDIQTSHVSEPCLADHAIFSKRFIAVHCQSKENKTQKKYSDIYHSRISLSIFLLIVRY